MEPLKVIIHKRKFDEYDPLSEYLQTKRPHLFPYFIDTCSKTCRIFGSLILENEASLESELEFLMSEFPSKDVDYYLEKHRCNLRGALLMMSLEKLAGKDGEIPKNEALLLLVLNF